jgi:DNA polymerase III subunit delta
MSFEEIIFYFKKKYKPIILLTGEEPYYIDKISNFVEKKIEVFDLDIFYGQEAKISDILSSLKRYPLIGKHRIVVLKEAQLIKNIDNLRNYAENPIYDTILLICYKHKSINKFNKFYKAVKKNGIIFESSKLHEYKIFSWILSYLRKFNYTISKKALALLVERLGNNLYNISNDLKKITLPLTKGAEINSRIVENNVGINRTYNFFEFQKALAKKSNESVYRIIRFFIENPKNYPLSLIINRVYIFFYTLIKYHLLNDNLSNVIPVFDFFLQASKNYSLNKSIDVISYLREASLRSKNNSSRRDLEILKELIFHVLN